MQFAEYIERNIRLYQIRNTYALRPSSAASWIRRSLAESLRSRKPYTVNLLLGGYDVTTYTPHLYWVDYFGTLVEVPFAAHGYGSYFALSLLDRYVCYIFYAMCPVTDRVRRVQVPRSRSDVGGGPCCSQAVHRRGVEAVGRVTRKVQDQGGRQRWNSGSGVVAFTLQYVSGASCSHGHSSWTFSL